MRLLNIIINSCWLIQWLTVITIPWIITINIIKLLQCRINVKVK